MPGHKHARRLGWAHILLLTPALAGCFGPPPAQPQACYPATVTTAESIQMQLDMASALDKHVV